MPPLPFPIPTLQQMTVGSAALGALYAALRDGKALTLQTVVVKALTASSLPTGIFLICAAFNPTLGAKLSDLGLYLLAAAIALIYVSLKELFKP
jgi:hypothetical protein